MLFPSLLKTQYRDFPGDPVTKTTHSQGRAPRVPSLVRELDLSYTAAKIWCSQINK